jgi:hypothetical protein
MDVISTHMQVVDYDSVLPGSLDQRAFDKVTKFNFHERLTVFGAPLKVELI